MTTANPALPSRFRLYLLGGASLIGPDGPSGAIAGDDQLIALLALLAAAPRGSTTVEAVAVTLRPELSPVDAVSALRDDVRRLQDAAGDDIVRLADERLTLEPALVWCDVASYRDHLARGDRLAAAADYQGPFLDRFHLPGAAAFNQWMHAERSQLALAFRELASALAAEAMADRDGQAAARWWTRLVDADPWNPRAAQQAMEGFEAMGERPAAIAVAEEYLERTAERLGREPDPQIREHLDALREAPPVRRRFAGRVAVAVVVCVVVIVLALILS